MNLVSKNNRPTRPKNNRPKTTLIDRIRGHLETLRIAMPIDQMNQLIQTSEQRQLAPLEFLERFLAEPARLRAERGIERRIREAGFPEESTTLESFDWKFNERWIDRAQMEQFATGDFVRRKHPLVFVGPSGLGKSHLIKGIGRALIVNEYWRCVVGADQR